MNNNLINDKNNLIKQLDLNATQFPYLSEVEYQKFIEQSKKITTDLATIYDILLHQPK